MLDEGLSIGGGGTIRTLRAAGGKAAVQTVHLDHSLATEPDGNLVDIVRVQGALEFTVTPYFLA